VSFTEDLKTILGVFDEASRTYRSIFNEEQLDVLERPPVKSPQTPPKKQRTPPPQPPPKAPPTPRNDPYTFLGVTPDAPDYVVKAAYKAAMKRVHTDVEGGDRKKAAQVNAAYENICRQRGWK
jgi:hypothetical protein